MDMVTGIRHIAVLVLGCLLLAVVIACGAGAPQKYTFDLDIKEQSLPQEDSVLQVKQDDLVTIIVTVDEPLTFHLHGYDIEGEAKPGEPAILDFTAHATGSFRFTAHVGADEEHMHGEEGHGCMREIPTGTALPSVQVTASPEDDPGHVRVAVELENFVLGNESTNTETLSGHWHLYIDGNPAGMYMQPQVTVRVEKAGKHQFMVVLSDTQHCEYDIDAMTMVQVEHGFEHSPEDHGAEEEGGEEIELGRLEVQPH
jgi:hypothetical protein